MLTGARLWFFEITIEPDGTFFGELPAVVEGLVFE